MNASASAANRARRRRLLPPLPGAPQITPAMTTAAGSGPDPDPPPSLLLGEGSYSSTFHLNHSHRGSGRKTGASSYTRKRLSLSRSQLNHSRLFPGQTGTVRRIPYTMVLTLS